MKEVNSNQEQLKRNLLELTELKHILQKTQTFFDEVCNLCYVNVFSFTFSVVTRFLTAFKITRFLQLQMWTN